MRQLVTGSLMSVLILVVASDALTDLALAHADSAVRSSLETNAPAADAAATETSALIWLIPVAMGVFAFILVFVIRRYSKPGRQGQAQQDIDKPGR